MIRNIKSSNIFRIITAFLCVAVPHETVIFLYAYQANLISTLYHTSGNRKDIIASFSKHGYYCVPTTNQAIMLDINKYTRGKISGTYYISMENLSKGNDNLDLCVPIHNKRPIYLTYHIQFVIVSQVKYIVTVEIKVSSIGTIS